MLRTQGGTRKMKAENLHKNSPQEKSKKTRLATTASTSNPKHEGQLRIQSGPISELVPSDFDVLNIYADISKLGAIERYLNLLYRPFSCFVHSGCEFKLSELDWFLTDTLYDPERHSALLIRSSKPTCSLKVYENGNIYCQGFGYESAAVGVQHFNATMKDLGYEAVFGNPKFNVINATFCVPFPISLDTFCQEHSKDCEYNPDVQPYLIYSIRKEIIKLAIFPDGYVFVMLASQPRLTQRAIAFIMPLLYHYRAAHESYESKLSSGDINFKLLWEREFQMTYQGILKYTISNVGE